jgi:hypothetical protein
MPSTDQQHILSTSTKTPSHAIMHSCMYTNLCVIRKCVHGYMGTCAHAHTCMHNVACPKSHYACACAHLFCVRIFCVRWLLTYRCNLRHDLPPLRVGDMVLYLPCAHLIVPVLRRCVCHRPVEAVVVVEREAGWRGGGSVLALQRTENRKQRAENTEQRT